MKGWKTRQLVWGCLALLTASYMTFWGPAPSWSENAGLATWFVLNVTLIAIANAFGETGRGHVARETPVFVWLTIPVRLKHLCRFTEYSFYSVLIFHLGSQILPDWMHMVSTGLAVAGLYFLMAGWFKTGTSRWLVSLISITLATVALILAFAFNLFEVKYPEFALAVIGFAFLRFVNKRKL